MTEDTMHPTCDVCGKYIFAVDGCKGHRPIPIDSYPLIDLGELDD